MKKITRELASDKGRGFDYRVTFRRCSDIPLKAFWGLKNFEVTADSASRSEIGVKKLIQGSLKREVN